MKKIIFIFIFILPILLLSCSGSSNEAELKLQLEIAERQNQELKLEKELELVKEQNLTLLYEKEAKPQAEAKAQAEVKAKVEAEAKAKAEAEAKAKAKSEAKAKAKAKVEAEAEAEAKSEAKAKSNIATDTENTKQSEDLNILQNYEVKVPTTPLDAPSEYSKNLTPIWETWAYLVRDYVNRSDLNEDEMTELVIKAMMKSLGDQHSNYISPEFFNVENTDMQGKYQGIGASVTMNANGNVVIVSPFEGSPAKKAGIRPGDIILEVNGESLDEYSLMEAINIIRGPEGTSVELLVKHLLSKDTELITIVRSSIKLDSVLLRSKPKSKIAHIRVTNFYPETAEDLSNMINKSKKEGAEAVLLDLRNNPGGLLSSVIDVTSLFLDDGVVIKEIDGYAREQIWKVKKSGPKYLAIPLVLLINNYSASASEVLAGALKDYKRAKIVGETSFGKGSIGILRPLSNGGGISVTIAKWYTPNNNLIDNKGIVPDIEIKSSDPSDTSGVQTEATLEYINNNILNK